MSTFHIKRGDLMPALTADLADGQGNPVGLTGATVNFVMADATGNVVIDAAATIDPAVVGRVRYFWLAGDTDNVGIYSAEFVVTAAGNTQSFPTTNFTRIEVVPDVEASVGASIADMDALRRMTDETDSSTFSATDLARYINNRFGDLNAAAFDIWTEKAATYAKLVNVSEAGSSRALGDLQDKALKMAAHYGERSVLTTNPVGRRATRTRAIVRP